MNWYLKVLKNYAGFDGRARRTEYWMFQLFNFIFILVAILFDTFLLDGSFVLQVLYLLAVLIPCIAVGVRRLHDQDKSGWLFLIILIPILGSLILFILFCFDGTSGDNKYGPDPKMEASA
tara:strand:- start:158 stop:517 length:360 start_codon:yes stop_codon:yes gene_type:complete